MSIPAHKQTDPNKAPGQIVNDVTLGDYIARKQRNDAFSAVAAENKLTFEEWWKTQVWAGFKNDPVGYMRNVWKAAQENKV